MLGDTRERWTRIIRVYTEPGIFESRYAYVDTVAISREGVNFTIHTRYDALPVRVDVTVSPTSGAWGPRAFSREDAPTGHTLVCKTELGSGAYLVEINVEGCLAYRAVSLIDELPF
jgi:hypothetical protein